MKKDNNTGVYKKMQRMAELTITMVLTGRLIRAKKILDAAEELFQSGNYQTRNAVLNVYVYNLSTVLQLHHHNVQTLFSGSLQREYIRQINAF